MTGTKWTDEELKVLRENYQLMSSTKVSELLPNKSTSSIHSKASRLKLKGRHPKRIYVDLGFFSSPNILNSYWAGLIASDGTVYRSKGRNELRVELGSKDRVYLQSFCDDLSFEGTIKGTKKDCCRATICGIPEILDDLERNFNIVERKTYCLEPPTHLSEELSKAFLVGLIDGDGTIGYYDHGASTLTCNLIMLGTQSVLEWAADVLDIPNEIQDKGTYFRIASYGSHAESILQHLKQIPVPKLARKWDKVPL